MTKVIAELVAKIFQGNVELATTLISILPLFELRGAIPFGMSTAFWGANAMSNWKSFLFAFIGSSLVSIPLTFGFKPFINLLKKMKWFNKLAVAIENRVNNHSQAIEKKYETNDSSLSATNGEQLVTENNVQTKEKLNKDFWGKFFGVMLFVAVPLPLTGVWTGSCVGCVLGLKPKWNILSVVLGNFIAGIIILTICSIFPNFTNIILYVFIGLIIIAIIYSLIKKAVKKRKSL